MHGISRDGYVRLTKAMNYYAASGYEYIDVPWIVPRKYVLHTAPPGAALFAYQADNYLVASAEQSFLYLMETQNLHGRYMALTPCFRNEVQYDALTRPYFMKVELFDSLNTTRECLLDTVQNACEFFRNYLPVVTIGTQDGIDIESMNNRIELGSYGIRTFDGRQYIYGTGVAEPRLSEAISRS